MSEEKRMSYLEQHRIEIAVAVMAVVLLWILW